MSSDITVTTTASTPNTVATVSSALEADIAVIPLPQSLLEHVDALVDELFVEDVPVTMLEVYPTAIFQDVPDNLILKALTTFPDEEYRELTRHKRRPFRFSLINQLLPYFRQPCQDRYVLYIPLTPLRLKSYDGRTCALDGQQLHRLLTADSSTVRTLSQFIYKKVWSLCSSQELGVDEDCIDIICTNDHAYVTVDIMYQLDEWQLQYVRSAKWANHFWSDTGIRLDACNKNWRSCASSVLDIDTSNMDVCRVNFLIDAANIHVQDMRV